MSDVYRVLIHPFAKKHFLKDLAKKHKTKWPLTEEALLAILRRPDAATRETSRLEIMSHDGDIRIVKGYFKIFGEPVSALKSGHRFIARLDGGTRVAELLVVYHKNHIKGSKETAWWQGLIKNL